MDEKKTPEEILAKAIKNIVKVIVSAAEEIAESKSETTSSQSEELLDELMEITKPLHMRDKQLSYESIGKICRFVYDNINQTIQNSSSNIDALKSDHSYYAPRTNKLYFYTPDELKIRTYDKTVRTGKPYPTFTVVMCITTCSNINCYNIYFEINKNGIDIYENRVKRFYDEFDEEILRIIEKVKFIMNMAKTTFGEMSD